MNDLVHIYEFFLGHIYDIHVYPGPVDENGGIKVRIIFLLKHTYLQR